MPDRLAKQVAFLREHPQHVVVGGAILKSIPIPIAWVLISYPRNTQRSNRRLTTAAYRTVPSHRTLPSLSRRSRGRLSASAPGGRRSRSVVEIGADWQAGHTHTMCSLCYRLHPSSLLATRGNDQRQNHEHVLAEATPLVGRSCQSHLRLSPALLRSPGGPGKWARMAARGYAPRTAISISFDCGANQLRQVIEPV